MKKVTLFFIIAAIFLAFISCGTSKKDDNSSSKNDNPASDNDLIKDDSNDSNPDDDSITPENDDNSSNPDENGGDDNPPVVSDGIISKIQMGEIKEGEEVTIKEAVITAIQYNLTNNQNSSIKGFYISEIISKALPYSGIYVFVSNAELDAFTVGNKVKVKGIVAEYYGKTQIAGINKDTMPEIEVLGTADIPEPAIVEPKDIATIFEPNGEGFSPTTNHGKDGEKYESVLVRVEDVEVIENPFKIMGTDGKSHGGYFQITDGLVVDKVLYYPFNDIKIAKGMVFESLTGILDYSYDAFKLTPRSKEDYKIKDSTEPGDDDTISSNDDDSVIPSDDETIPSETLKISDIQDEKSEKHPEVDTEVTIEGVVVLGVEHYLDKNNNPTGIKGIYVSEKIENALPYTGIYVHFAKSVTLGSFAAGDLVDVTGIYKEYYELSEITAEEINVVKKGTANLPNPAKIDDSSKIATIFEFKDNKWTPTTNHGTDAEKYEGVLLTISNVTVTQADLGYGMFEVTGNLAIDKALYYLPKDQRTGTFKSITGILNYTFGAYKLMPRSAEDFVR